jgi:hypothetical protein
VCVCVCVYLSDLCHYAKIPDLGYLWRRGSFNSLLWRFKTQRAQIRLCGTGHLLAAFLQGVIAMQEHV